MQMNEKPVLYNANNKIARHAAKVALEEFMPKLNWNKGNLRVIDIGCGDGSVTDMLRQYIPEDYGTLVGCDLSNAMVQFANDHYSDTKAKFIQLDITAELPTQLQSGFSHVFSFFAFHWIKDHEKGFRNLFNLLTKGGECLVTFYGHSPFYSTYIALSKTKKWAPHIKNINELIPAYHDHQSPDITLNKLLKEAGFSIINVQCKQMVYIFNDESEYRNIVAAINPFKMPTADMLEDFLNDYVQMSKQLQFIDDNTQFIKHNYNMLVFHCIK